MMIEVRRSHREDFPQILDLLRELWPGRELDEEAVRLVFLEALSSDSYVYFSACDQARVVGFASLHILKSLRTAGPFGHLDELIVAAAVRGRGIGGRLLDAATVAAQARNCLRVEFNSGIQRADTHRFYESRGFERRAFHFFGPPLAKPGTDPAPAGGPS
ncbi:MAG: GNAT family N-acetyltransferase [Vicinamibacterales bacterium]